MVPEEQNLTIYDIQQKSKLEISATSLLSGGVCEPVSVEAQLADQERLIAMLNARKDDLELFLE